MIIKISWHIYIFFFSKVRGKEGQLGLTPLARRYSYYVNSSSRQVFGLIYIDYDLMRRQLSGERNTHRRDTLIALLDIIEVLGKVQNYIMKALEYLQDIPTHIHPWPPAIFGGSNSLKTVSQPALLCYGLQVLIRDPGYPLIWCSITCLRGYQSSNSAK